MFLGKTVIATDLQFGFNKVLETIESIIPEVWTKHLVEQIDTNQKVSLTMECIIYKFTLLYILVDV